MSATWPAAWLQAPETEEIRRTAEEVFAREEFARRKTLWQRIVEWIADHARCNVQQLSFNEVMRPGA